MSVHMHMQDLQFVSIDSRGFAKYIKVMNGGCLKWARIIIILVMRKWKNLRSQPDTGQSIGQLISVLKIQRAYNFHIPQKNQTKDQTQNLIHDITQDHTYLDIHYSSLKSEHWTCKSHNIAFLSFNEPPVLLLFSQTKYKCKQIFSCRIRQIYIHASILSPLVYHVHLVQLACPHAHQLNNLY